MKAPEIVDDLLRERAIAPIDRHFAALMADLAPGDDTSVALAAALASAATREGHTCLDLEELAGREGPQGLHMPGRDAWIAALEASPVVRQPTSAAPAPLVLAGGKRLYLERLFELERAVAAGIRDLCSGPLETAHSDVALVDRHVPQGAAGEGLRKAVTIALGGRFCCISGGPGTGKTTIVARILSVLLDAGLVSPGGIALTAPTGKAAARLQQAVRDASARPDMATLDARTVHRWLLSNRWREEPTRLLVVDEASMVDINIMGQVLATLPETARLVLLGDSMQLASVQPGSVFADLVAAGASGSSPLHSRIVELRHNWRFDPEGGIGRLAEAIRRDDADGVIAAFDDPEEPAVTRRPLDGAEGFRQLALRLTEEIYGPLVRGMASAPEDGFDPFSGFAVLCGHRRGPFGSARFNRLVEEGLRASGLARQRDGFYVGRPVIITRNDPATGLSNGDTGIVFRAEDGGRNVLFPQLRDDAGKARVLPPGRLPDHESVFAMTVHRAQGSEYQDVMVVPGGEDSAILTRELLYTAVTRARRTVAIHGGDDEIRAALANRTRRLSGLFDALTA
ncbi:MAG: exodeoxyribonuclease V subunit alpha [bacterium]|nr:exodeoxyribonuclease V subunit alpha [bacterium]